MPPSRPDATPLALLEGCHRQIRRTLRGLAALADRGHPADPLARTTAEACLRYLRVGLPLHSEDEDESLAPRLLEQHGLPPAVPAALDTMEAEHEAIHRAVDELVHQLERWLDGDAVVLAPAHLTHLLEAHLALEESVVFPHVSALSEDVQRRLVGEVRQRRRGP